MAWQRVKRRSYKEAPPVRAIGSNRRACAGIRLNFTGASLEASDWPLEVEGHLPGRGGGPTALTTIRPSGRLFLCLIRSAHCLMINLRLMNLIAIIGPAHATCVHSPRGVHSFCSVVRGFARAVFQPAGAQSDRKAVEQSGDRRNRLRSKNRFVLRDGVVRHGDARCVRVLGCVPEAKF